MNILRHSAAIGKTIIWTIWIHRTEESNGVIGQIDGSESSRRSSRSRGYAVAIGLLLWVQHVLPGVNNISRWFFLLGWLCFEPLCWKWWPSWWLSVSRTGISFLKREDGVRVLWQFELAQFPLPLNPFLSFAGSDPPPLRTVSAAPHPPAGGPAPSARCPV